jgi:hypothetical protein
VVAVSWHQWHPRILDSGQAHLEHTQGVFDSVCPRGIWSHTQR